MNCWDAYALVSAGGQGSSLSHWQAVWQRTCKSRAARLHPVWCMRHTVLRLHPPRSHTLPASAFATAHIIMTVVLIVTVVMGTSMSLHLALPRV